MMQKNELWNAAEENTFAEDLSPLDFHTEVVSRESFN